MIIPLFPDTLANPQAARLYKAKVGCRHQLTERPGSTSPLGAETHRTPNRCHHCRRGLTSGGMQNDHFCTLAATTAALCFPCEMGQNAMPESQSSKDVLLAQYGVVAARRQNFDAMVWQVPALALTAQAFLMTIALGPETGHLARIAAGLLSALAALMSVQLLLRQRAHELADARWLHKFELKHGWEPIHQHPDGRVAAAGIEIPRFTRMRSHRFWIAGMAVFGTAGLAAALAAL